MPAQLLWILGFSFCFSFCVFSCFSRVAEAQTSSGPSSEDVSAEDFEAERRARSGAINDQEALRRALNDIRIPGFRSKMEGWLQMIGTLDGTPHKAENRLYQELMRTGVSATGADIVDELRKRAFYLKGDRQSRVPSDPLTRVLNPGRARQSAEADVVQPTSSERNVEVRSNISSVDSAIHREYRSVQDMFRFLVRLQDAIQKHRSEPLLKEPFLRVQPSVSSSNRLEAPQHSSNRISSNPYSEASARLPLNENTILPGNVDRRKIGKKYEAWKARVWYRGIRGSKDALKNVGTGLTHFGPMYVAFMFVVGMVTFSQLALDYDKNPTAFNDYVAQTKDLAGAASFAVFMYTAFKTIKFLENMGFGDEKLGQALVRAGDPQNSKALVPYKRRRPNIKTKLLIPFMGMTVGLLASTLFYDVVTDKNLVHCVKSLFKAEAQCMRAYESWVPSQKISEYTPTVAAFVGSLGVAAGVGFGLVKGAKALKSSPKLGGLWVGPKGVSPPPDSTLGRVKDIGKKLIKGGGYVAKTPMAIATGGLAIFFGVEYFLGPTIHHAFDHFKWTTFDIKAWLDRYVFPPKVDGSDFLEPDVYLTEATNLPSVDKYWSHFVDSWSDNNWAQPEEHVLPLCYYEERVRQGMETLPLPDTLFDKDDTDGKSSYRPGGQTNRGRRYQSVRLRSKSEAMRQCEVLSQPLRFIDRHAQVQHSWRVHLIEKFQESFIGWLKWMSVFSQELEYSKDFYAYFAQLKLNESRGEGAPDLSRKALTWQMAKIMGLIPEPSSEQGKDSSTETEKDSLDPFVEQYAYQVLAWNLEHMACGRELDESAPVIASQDFEEKGVLSSVMKSGEYRGFKNPVGSPVSFTPPRVIGSYLKSPCEIYDFRFQNGQPPSFAGETIEDVRQREKEHASYGSKGHYFNSLWSGEDLYGDEEKSSQLPRFPMKENRYSHQTTTYSSLAELIYDKMPSRFYESSKYSSKSNMLVWWDDQVRVHVDSIWSFFEDKYRDIYEKEFLPKLYKRADCDPCNESSDYNGVYQSLFNEVRKYSSAILGIVNAIENDYGSSNTIEQIKGQIDRVHHLFEAQEPVMVQLAEQIPDRWWILQDRPSERAIELTDEIFESFTSTEEELEVDMVGADLAEFMSAIPLDNYANENGELDDNSYENWNAALTEKLTSAEFSQIVMLDHLTDKVNKHLYWMITLGRYGNQMSFGSSIDTSDLKDLEERREQRSHPMGSF